MIHLYSPCQYIYIIKFDLHVLKICYFFFWQKKTNTTKKCFKRSKSRQNHQKLEELLINNFQRKYDLARILIAARIYEL